MRFKATKKLCGSDIIKWLVANGKADSEFHAAEWGIACLWLGTSAASRFN